MGPEVVLYCVPRPGVFVVTPGLIGWRPQLITQEHLRLQGPPRNLWQRRIPASPSDDDGSGHVWRPAELLDALTDLAVPRQGRSDEERAAGLALRLGSALGDCGLTVAAGSPHVHRWRGFSWPTTPSLRPKRSPRPAEVTGFVKIEFPGEPNLALIRLEEVAEVLRLAPGARLVSSPPAAARAMELAATEPLSAWLDLARLVNAMRRVVVAIRQADEPDRDDVRRLWPPSRPKATWRYPDGPPPEYAAAAVAPVLKEAELPAFDPDTDPLVPVDQYGRVVAVVSGWLRDLHVASAMLAPEDVSEPAVEVLRLGSLAAVVAWQLSEELLGKVDVYVCRGFHGRPCGVTWARERHWDPEGRIARPDRLEARERNPRFLCKACDDARRVAHPKGSPPCQVCNAMRRTAWGKGESDDRSTG